MKKILLTGLLVLTMAHTVCPDDGSGSLRVEVRDFKRARPLEGARVLVSPCNVSGITDSRGEVLFDQVTPFRNYQVEVELDGYIGGAAGFVAVQASELTRSVIPLKQKSTLTGRITVELLFGFVRLPLRNARVKLQLISDGSFITIGEVTTNALGRYTFHDLDEGDYRISAQAEGFTGALKQVRIEGSTTNREHLSLQWHWEDPAAATESNPRAALYTKPVSPGSDDIPAVLPCILDITTGRDVSLSNQFFLPPEAVPSVIPGPSELPYLYNDKQIFTSTSGSRSSAAGTTVYLRGFAVDSTLVTPQEFNPDAPCFDVYGNKNGNFSASIFAYRWTLRGSDGRDYTALLNPSPTSENVFFEIPDETRAGDTFIAALRVKKVLDDMETESAPEEITIVVAERGDEATCAGCHAEKAAGYAMTAHAMVAGGAECQDCHGPGSEHISGDPAAEKLSLSYWSGTCGQCHGEFAEFQKSNHTDPLPFGYYEPGPDLVRCYRCHYTPGYIGAVKSGKDFHTYIYDGDKSAIPQDTPNVSCSVCHDSHSAGQGNPYGLRTGSAGTACDTCHYEKWQNALLEGLAGTFGNAYHYENEDYGVVNGHRTGDKCVLCHMDTTIAAKDENGVLVIGGHTFRMRDFGPDNTPGTDDDVLNTAPCRRCHPGLDDFDRNGFQSEVQSLLNELQDILTGKNHGFLPANEPGNCARCHKGGTLPFLDDPENILEHAYTNYKLIVNDRSRGIHNPGYIKKLLQDSIASVKRDYAP